MIEVSVGVVNGKPMMFKQAISIEEAKAEGMPEGIYSFWQTEKGERIYSPQKIVQMIVGDIAQQQGPAFGMITPDNFKDFFRRVREAQGDLISEALEKQKRIYRDLNAPAEAIDEIDKTMDLYRQGFKIDDDGMYRPDGAAATALAGEEEMKRTYPPDVLKERFGLD